MRRNEYLKDHYSERRGSHISDSRRSPERRNRYSYYRKPVYDYEHDSHYVDYYSDDYDADHEYEEDLKEWIDKLKSKDKFKLAASDIIHKAKAMGVTFRDYDELEFEATYYMLLSDFGSVSNDPHSYIAMAKSFLEDDDISVSPSEKLCIYFYEIVKGD